MTYHRVDTYSVYGGCELTSRARPKSAILIMDFETNMFSVKRSNKQYSRHGLQKLEALRADHENKHNQLKKHVKL